MLGQKSATGQRTDGGGGGTEQRSDRDFVLSGEVGPFAQQLALRQGEDAGGLSDQHRVVETIVARSRRDQVTALKTNTRRRRRRKKKSGEKQLICTRFISSADVCKASKECLILKTDSSSI